jgi:RNA polymerase sigma-70 factor (ECF subfamily)
MPEEEADFEALFQRHWSRVYAAIFRLVGDHAEAEDLALEVFWRYHRRPPRERGNPSGWLYRVATNLGYNALRGRKRREHYEGEAGRQALLNGSAPDPALEAEGAELRTRVRQALASLKSRSAQLLVLRHSGLSYAEIAAALEMPQTSVGKLLARAEAEFEARYLEIEEDAHALR